jgi:chromosome segregation ATPase
MIDSLGAINRKGVHITPWGAPHPHCPGCRQLPKSVPQSHACPELNGLLTTARAQCPFCEGQKAPEGVVNGEELRDEVETPRVRSLDEPATPSIVVLEELERKASEIKALEAEAEAREAKAQERLRQVEARLRQEMVRRSEVERKSQEIEDDLKRQHEIDQGRMEFVRAATEAAGRFEEERKARIAAEQSKAEAEAKLREMDVSASKAEERLRQTDAGLQQAEGKLQQAETKLQQAETKLQQAETKLQQTETKLQQTETKLQQAETKLQQAETKLQQTEAGLKQAEAGLKQAEAGLQQTQAKLQQTEAGLQREASKRSLAEERANEIEIRLAADNAKVVAEAEAKVQGVRAEARRIEENYKAEIGWIRDELEMLTESAKLAEENHIAEIARITAEAEARTQQVEANTRQQYQIKVEQAIANTQAALFNLEETQRKLDETEARRQEIEDKARQVENLCRRLFLISKLSFTSAEQIIAETLGAGDENEKDALVIPLDLATDTYSDDFSSEAPASAANGSLDYENYQFSARMKALFEAAARVNATDDKVARADNGE